MGEALSQMSRAECPGHREQRCQISKESSEVWVTVSQASPVGDDVGEVMGCQVMGGLGGHGKSIGFCFP